MTTRSFGPTRNFGAILALSALTALPACSMFGGHSNNSQASAAPPPPPASTSSTMASNAGNMPSSDASQMMPSHRTIREAQAKLKPAGDYQGRIDGVWGPMTEAGVRKWQQAHNLNVSGQLDMATLQSMNVQPTGQAMSGRMPSNTEGSAVRTGGSGGPANNNGTRGTVEGNGGKS
jgi:peptidoglycan hydrolase-like protein with peptidoglycan-binding domain